MTASTLQAGGARGRIAALRASHPEAAGVLDLIEAVVDAAADPVWQGAASGSRLPAERDPARPVLAGATVPLDREAVDRWARQVLRLAGESAPASSSLLGAAADPRFDALAWFAAVAAGDDLALHAQSTALAADPGQYGAAGAFAVMPLFHALRRRWGALADPTWRSGACPVCGAWAAMAEMRGLDRARRLRCARCGGDWAFPALRCFSCDETDHAKLTTLVPEGQGEASRASACETCGGFLKELATLRAWDADEIVLADLSSLELDVAAIDAGFRRPEGSGLPLDLRLEAA